VVLWSIDTRDWQGRQAEAMAGHVLAELRPGDIVLFHDGGGRRTNTAAALAALLPALRRQGYACVTLAEMALHASGSHATWPERPRRPPGEGPAPEAQRMRPFSFSAGTLPSRMTARASSIRSQRFQRRTPTTRSSSR
jgi:hypothetical protein